MRHISFILLALVLTSCGVDRAFSIPADVKPYVQDFEQAIGRPATGIGYGFGVLGFSAENGGVIGQCSLPSQVITLDINFWNQATDEQRELVVLHELGHCVLFRAHLTAWQPNSNFFTSIMAAYIMNDYQFTDQHDYYINELANTKNVPMITIGGSSGETIHKCRFLDASHH